jgi:hypothetical protein
MHTIDFSKLNHLKTIDTNKFDITKFTNIQIQKINTVKLSLCDKNPANYDELYSKIPNHSHR